MEYRLLGKTGLSVSILGFGASPLGGSFGSIDEEEGIRSVHAAVDRGINLIDVSPYYGQTLAETVLGHALKSIDRDRYILATKAGRYGRSDFDFSSQRIIQSVEESLQRLNVETIDIFQCHDIEFVPLSQVIDEAIPAMHRLKSQGKVRFIGITGLPLKVYREVLKAVELDVILSYCHYTLFDTSLLDLIPLLSERGLGVMNAAPFSMGLLTKRPAPEWHPAPKEVQEECARQAALWDARGFDLAELALRFSVGDEGIASTFAGMSTVEEVQRNVNWSEKPWDSELMAEAYSSFNAIRNRTWQSGLPENN
jgi:L-galactose dehydrogenase